MTALVQIRDLYVRFTGDRTVYALNGVSLSLEESEVLGLIGESGSGKSVTLRALMRLLPPHKTIVEGTAEIAGQDVMTLGSQALMQLRGRVISMRAVMAELEPADGARFWLGMRSPAQPRFHRRTDGL